MHMSLVVGSGATLAATISCDGGVCEGTDLSDNLMTTGAVRDIFYGFGDLDRLNAGSGDVLYDNEGDDVLRSGHGDHDTIAVQDGVFDKVNCGPGDYEAVVIDRGLDSIRNGENVYWQ